MGEVTVEYMDVFCNPVALQYSKSLDPGSKHAGMTGIWIVYIML
jgi:hypothetical protein